MRTTWGKAMQNEQVQIYSSSDILLLYQRIKIAIFVAILLYMQHIRKNIKTKINTL